jgi:hypothetical protein
MPRLAIRRRIEEGLQRHSQDCILSRKVERYSYLLEPLRPRYFVIQVGYYENV